MYRLTLAVPETRVAQHYFGHDLPVGDRVALYNLGAEDQVCAIMCRDHERPRPDLMRVWWDASAQGGTTPSPLLIDSEDVAEHPRFQDAYRHRRCLFPVSGWFAWQRSDRTQPAQPWYFTLADPGQDEVLFLAGLWQYTGEGITVRAGLLTEPANSEFATVCTRQPLTIDPEARWDWLDPGKTDPASVRDATRRLAPSRLVAYPVGDGIGKTGPGKSRGPDLIEPLDGRRIASTQDNEEV